MRHRHRGLSTYGLNGQRQGDEHPRLWPFGAWHYLPHTIESMLIKHSLRSLSTYQVYAPLPFTSLTHSLPHSLTHSLNVRCYQARWYAVSGHWSRRGVGVWDIVDGQYADIDERRRVVGVAVVNGVATVVLVARRCRWQCRRVSVEPGRKDSSRAQWTAVNVTNLSVCLSISLGRSAFGLTSVGSSWALWVSLGPTDISSQVFCGLLQCESWF